MARPAKLHVTVELVLLVRSGISAESAGPECWSSGHLTVSPVPALRSMPGSEAWSGARWGICCLAQGCGESNPIRRFWRPLPRPVGLSPMSLAALGDSVVVLSCCMATKQEPRCWTGVRLGALGSLAAPSSSCAGFMHSFVRDSSQGWWPDRLRACHANSSAGHTRSPRARR